MNNPDYAALVAFDWGHTEHAYALRMREGQEELGSIPATAEDLHGWLEQLGQRCQGQSVALAIEGGRNGVVHALLTYSWLEVYPIHPATSDRFRKAFTPSGAKDDLPDAQVLLTILTQHRDQLRRLRPDTPQTRELAALTEVRRGAVDRRTQLAVELISTLKTHFPQALALVGRSLWTALALDFLERWPELALLQKAKPATLRGFYYSHSSRRPAVVDHRLEFIATARPLTTDRAVLNPAVMKVHLLVAVLRPLQQHIEQIDAQIEACFGAHPEAHLFRSLPGAGPALAPRLLVAFGTDRSRFPDAASLQKYAGVAPVKVKSGHQLWIHWRWNASVFLRQTFVEWAGQTVPKCAWAKVYYRQQQRAGKNHQTILRALAFKSIRVLWRCWHDGVPYDAARYIAALQQRRSPLAAQLSAA